MEIKRVGFALLLVFYSFVTFASSLQVDLLTGGAKIENIDVPPPSNQSYLQFIRTYNSRNLVNKNILTFSFGTSWYSILDSSLSFLTNRDGLLWDGITGESLLFKHNKLTNEYVSTQAGKQTLKPVKNLWKRENANIIQIYDNLGRLQSHRETSGFQIDFSYKENTREVKEIVSKSDANQLKFVYSQGRVTQVLNSRNQGSKYDYDAQGRLIFSVDIRGNSYSYFYQNAKLPQLITRISYKNADDKSESFREISYYETGFVKSNLDPDGTLSSYTYGKDPAEPEKHFWTKLTEVTAKGKKRELFNEFWLSENSSGKYLAREFRKIGSLESTVFYESRFNKPEKTIINGVPTTYKYGETGELIEKQSNEGMFGYEYHPYWKKISQVTHGTYTFKYDYDKQGILKSAMRLNKNKEKIAVEISYGKKDGRISSFVFQENNLPPETYQFQYNAFGKLEKVTQNNTGTLALDFDAKTQKYNGARAILSVQKPGSEKSLIEKVSLRFHLFIELLKPVGSSVVF